MDDFRLIPMFSVPLYTAFDLDITNEHKETVSIQEFEPTRDQNGFMTRSNQILDIPELVGIKNQVDFHVQKYVLKVFNPTDDIQFYMTASWAMLHFLGNFSPSHWHVNSIISGILYIDVDDNSGDLVFVNKNSTLYHPQIRIPSKGPTDYNRTEEYVKPKPNQIVIFPSILSHAVTVSNSDIERYCIAFNYFIRGKLGNGDKNLVIL